MREVSLDGVSDNHKNISFGHLAWLGLFAQKFEIVVFAADE